MDCRATLNWSIGLHTRRLTNRLVVLEHRSAILATLSSLLLLHALFELRLKPFFTTHGRGGLRISLLLLVYLQWAFVCIVTLLLAVEADDTHVLHLTHWVHHLNVTELLLSDLILLTISRFVAFHSTSVANDLAFILSHVVLPSMHRL